MSNKTKRRAKAQRRGARKRAEKTRRQLAEQCAQWMYDAEDAWLAKDLPRARRCFQRILHVRQTHQAANERMAELLFIDGLQAEGLRHFDRLVEPPEFPIIDFRAAVALPDHRALRSGRGTGTAFPPADQQRWQDGRPARQGAPHSR